MNTTTKQEQLHREGEGAYRLGKWSIQNPNLMEPTNPDTNWYGTTNTGDTIVGPFDTLAEAKEYITRFDNISAWRERTAQTLLQLGREDLATEIRTMSNHEAMTYRDTNEDPQAAAQALINLSPPRETRKYQVTISDTYTTYRTIEVEAGSEYEAKKKAEREYEETYDAEEALTLLLLAHNDAAGDYEAIEAIEIPDPPNTTN